MNQPPQTRGILALALLILLSTAALLVVPAPAGADTSSTLTVVGTSAISDSGLVANLIAPEFEHAYPQFTFTYIARATGELIASASGGSSGASAMILDAPSLENQFVAQGYSYERYGRAIITGDYVLAGPQGDPAGASEDAPHDIAQAFADIAAAGINGGRATRITFVSSGGTPGTTVEEHSIWQLVQSSGIAPAGLLLCALNAPNGGGLTPVAPGNGVTASGQPCPGAGALPAPAALPAWYVTTGDGEGANVQAADACNGFLSGPGSCYVLTNRGTYDYLASRTDPAGSIANLKVVTRGPQGTASPGGPEALISSFHAYIIGPLRLGEAVNLTAAHDFVDFLTSTAFGAQLRRYLAHAGDADGPPFVADAAPIISASGIPRIYHAGRKVTVTGAVTTAQRGYPALAGVTVNVDKITPHRTITVATGMTNALGRYAITFAPTSTGSYAVATPQIAQIENAALNPPFGDLLSRATGRAVPVSVHSTILNLRVRSAGGRAIVIGSVAPGTGHIDPIVQVYARPVGSRSGFTKVAVAHPAADDGNFAVAPSLAARRWQFRVTFRDPQRVVAATSRTVTATIGAPPRTSIGVRSLKVSPRGDLTITGSLQPHLPAGGARVDLLGLDTSSGKPVRFRVFARTTIPGGSARFTLRAHLRHGHRYVVALECGTVGQASSFSELRTVGAD